MNELKNKLRIVILISVISGITSLVFPQWYSGIFFAINTSIPLGPNAREIALALSMFSISLLLISTIGLLKSHKKTQHSELYSSWTIWCAFGILIILAPTLHLIICYNLCINFWSFTIFGLELIFSYLSGALALAAGIITRIINM